MFFRRNFVGNGGERRSARTDPTDEKSCPPTRRPNGFFPHLAFPFRGADGPQKFGMLGGHRLDLARAPGDFLAGGTKFLPQLIALDEDAAQLHKLLCSGVSFGPYRSKIRLGLIMRHPQRGHFKRQAVPLAGRRLMDAAKFGIQIIGAPADFGHAGVGGAGPVNGGRKRDA